MELRPRRLATSRRPLLPRVPECSGILRSFLTNDHTPLQDGPVLRY